MLKKTVTYRNPFDDSEETEDLYFHLTMAEISKLEISADGGNGLAETLKRLISSRNGKEIIANFDNVLKMAYGERSEDGKRLVKTDEVWERFKSSEAYSVIFMELITDPKNSAEFVNALLPKEARDAIAKKGSETVEDDRPAWIKEDREPTSAELQSMTKEQMLDVFARRMRNN